MSLQDEAPDGGTDAVDDQASGRRYQRP